MQWSTNSKGAQNLVWHNKRFWVGPALIPGVSDGIPPQGNGGSGDYIGKTVSDYEEQVYRLYLLVYTVPYNNYLLALYYQYH